MKMLKMIGAFAAVHALAAILIFSNPGCTSTTPPATASASSDSAKSPPPSVALPPSAADSSPVAPAHYAGDMSSSPSISFDPNAPAVSGPRYTPTRPGTAAASTLETAPAPEVTPATTYAVANGDSLWTIAKKHHLSVGELAAANNLRPDSTLKLGQKLIIPGKAMGGAAKTAGDGAPTYRVKTGDTLAGIAQRAGTTSAVLKKLNNLKSDTVRSGQELKLPAGANIAADVPAASSTDSSAPVKNANGSMTHVVKQGETLSSIAQKYQVRYSDIATANSITDPSKVRAGMTLVIPGWQAPKSGKSGDMSAKAPAGDSKQVPKISTDESDSQPAPRPAPQVPVINIEEPANSPKSL
jgi:LysM repeat protein